MISLVVAVVATIVPPMLRSPMVVPYEILKRPPLRVIPPFQITASTEVLVTPPALKVVAMLF